MEVSNFNLIVPILEINVDTPNRIKLLQNGINRKLERDILGRGSFGTVVKAVYKGKQVAVKILNSSHQSVLATIKNESNILGWQHKNIISILKIDYSSTYSAIIMERFPSQCLQLILDKKKIPLPHRLCISLDIFNGLNFCHQNNLLHLDIKPQNILVAFVNSPKVLCPPPQAPINNGYVCKLCDFGSSMKINQHRKIAESRIQGTIRYMSPEALTGQTLTPQSDIYSAGITMWQLESSENPYSIIDCNDTVAYKVVKENLRPNSNCFRTEKSMQTIHRQCICEHFSCEPSTNCFHNIDDFLNSSQIFFGISGQATKCRSLFLKSTSTNRSPFKWKHQNIATHDKSPKNIYKIQPTDDRDQKNSNSFDLNSIFMPIGEQSYDQLEFDYTKIYQLCWNCLPTDRPSGMVIIQLLQNILNNI